jgi:5-formyltetrahydrofolate cyclo-ligase
MDPMARAAKDRALCEHLRSWLEARANPPILAFAAFGSEPSLQPLLGAYPGELALPIIAPKLKGMVFRRYRDGDPTMPNRFGIREPLASAPEFVLGPATCILVPALAIDASGHRLGYGGGYYDRFLSGHRDLIKLGIIYHNLFGVVVPVDSHDVPVDYVATENGIFLGGRS